MPTVSMNDMLRPAIAGRNRANVMSWIGQMTVPTPQEAAGP